MSNSFSSKTVVILVGFIPLLFKSIIIKKYSYYPFIGLIFYFGTFLSLHDANQIRLAAACIFMLYALMLNENISKTKLFLSLAATFHYTGILLLILLFKNRKYLALTLILLRRFCLCQYLNTLKQLMSLSKF